MSNQMDIFRDTPGKAQRPGAAALTQRAAATEITPATGSLRRRVFDYISSVPFGATDEETQIALGLNPSTQRPRRIELVERGLVEDSGRTRKTASGRSAVVWVATEKKGDAL